MSAFEFVVTPTRVRNARKLTENREPTIVSLGAFTAKAIVTFEDVPVTKSAKRFIVIQNPVNEEITVSVTKSPKQELNVSLEWSRAQIGPSSEVSMTISWSPLKAVSCKETIQLTDSLGNKKDVSLVFKSLELKKTSKKPGVISIPKRLKMKTPSPPGNLRRSIFSKKVTTTTVHQEVEEVCEYQQVIVEERPALAPRNMNASNIFETDVINFSTIDSMFEITSPKKVRIEKSVPTTPLGDINASDIFDNIKFTPATETKSKSTSKLEYFASMPTPQGVRRGEYTRKNLMNEVSPDAELKSVDVKHQIEAPIIPMASMKTPAPLSSRQNNLPLNTLSTPQSLENGQFFPCNFSTMNRDRVQSPNHFMDQIVQKVLFEKSLEYESNISTETYIKDLSCQEIELVLEEQKSLLGRTHVLCSTPPLSAIFEESPENIVQKTFLKTFNVYDGKSLSKDNIAALTSGGGNWEKSRVPTSESLTNLCLINENVDALKANLGSLPNLNVKVVDHLENNRYFYQNEQQEMKNKKNVSMESLTSQGDFRETEICAQSSRFNLNELGLPTRKCSSKLNDVEHKSPIFASKISNSPQIKQAMKSSPTMQRIREDFRFKSPLKKQPMVFSPPRKVKMEAGDFDGRIEKKDLGASSKTNKLNDWTKKHSKFKLPLSLKKPPPMTTSLTSLSSSITSIVSNTSAVSMPVTPRSYVYKKDPVVLYDAESHLTTFINPDPFAASTTCDPFLSATMYLNEQAVDKIEKQFVKWLNALVTIPADLDSDHNQKLDVGKLFQEVQSKELKMAPTKELVSSKYYKTRIDSLRSLAYNFYRTSAVAEPLKKVAIQIDKKLLTIREDRNIHLDLVLQRNVLELLLCFNPLWLRIGLEVVFGVQIDLQSNRDVLGLSRFIITHMFRDSYLESKYNKYQHQSAYAENIKKFTLRRFLFVILFLDKAKQSHLIKHNPCLFVKNAPYKETNEILKKFASMVIANFGDIIRYLKRVDYLLVHKQTCIDEFNYAFSNLAVDLRDGVRLTKVMEVILLRDDLTKNLRAPAISRLQKVFNVDLGLKALQQADYNLKGDITAKDIVDGHREKTLSLLWQIIYKFRSPRFISAAITIQQWWRRKWLRVYVNRRILHKHEERQNAAATCIQKWIRGYNTRKQTKEFLQKKRDAVLTIQKHMRMIMTQRRFQKIKHSVKVIQQWYRETRVMRVMRRQYMIQRTSSIVIQRWYRNQLFARKLVQASILIKHVKSEAKSVYFKAVTIQRCIKSFVVHKKFHEMVNGIVAYNRKVHHKEVCATKIQSLIKMRSCRKQFLQLKAATTTLQQKWIATLLMREERAKYIMKQQSTLKIQKWYRICLVMKRDRKQFLILRELTIKVQLIFKGKLLMRVQRHEFLVMKYSAVVLQQRFRARLLMIKDKSEFQQLQQSTINIQRRFRAQLQMKVERKKFLELRGSIIKVQQRFRATVEMKKYVTKYQLIRTSTITIQQKLRATLVMRTIRQDFLTKKMAAISIQQRFRANQLMRIEKQKLQQLKRVTIYVQQRFRANQTMKVKRKYFLQLKMRTMILQQKFRATKLMHKEYLAYVTMQYYANALQRQYRAQVLMRKDKSEFQKLKGTTITIQRRFRCKLQMKADRSNFLKLKQKTILIQQRLRATLKMRKEQTSYQILRISCILIQQKYRAQQMMKKERSSYLQLKQAVHVLESQYHARTEMIRERSTFLSLKTTAAAIQQRFRANVLGKQGREQFLLKKDSAVKIQRYFKGFLLMRHEVEVLAEYKMSIITVQQRYRAKLAMKQARNQFLKLKEACQNIQIRFRANQLMKLERQEYLDLRSAAITFQQHFLAQSAMWKEQSAYSKLKRAALIIQERWRATLLMKNERKLYHQLKQSSVNIQQRFRANQLMKVERANYEQMKSATTTIQIHLRGHLETKRLRSDFLKLKTATLMIQRRYREVLLARKNRQLYVQIRLATMKIQCYYRGLKLMQQQKLQYDQLKTASIFVQRRFKALVAGRNARSEFQRLKWASLTIQRRWRATLLMRMQREQFVVLKVAVVLVQQNFRAKQMMQIQRRQFLTLKNAAICVQTRFRSYQLMKQQRSYFCQLKKSVLHIQQRFKANQLMKIEVLRFANLRMQTVRIQQHFRANQLMKEERLKFVAYKSAALVIQRHFRAKLLMKQDRDKFLSLKQSVKLIETQYLAIKEMRFEINNFQILKMHTITIQRRFRAKLETRVTRKRFQETRTLTVKLQTRIRGYLARKSYQQMLTPEMLELRNRHKAAKKIQAMWRGRCLRKKMQTKNLRAIADRLLQARRNADPTKTLQNKLKMSIKFLKGKYNAVEAIAELTKLEYISRTIPSILIQHANFVSSFCYGLMAQAIRSEVDKQVIELCSCIILNLGRYQMTKEDAFQEMGLGTIAQMLMRWSDKNCGIFNTLCTLVWVFAHTESNKMKVREFMTAPTSLYVLPQIKSLVLRMERMQNNRKKPVGYQSISLKKYQKEYQNQQIYMQEMASDPISLRTLPFPSIDPDYGVVKTKPYIFYSSVAGFDAVLNKLNIRL